MLFKSFNVFDLLEANIDVEEDEESQDYEELGKENVGQKPKWVSSDFDWSEEVVDNVTRKEQDKVNDNDYDDDDDKVNVNVGWTTIASKIKEQKEKRKEVKERVEKRQVERDVRYLLTHAGFQKHRLTRDLILDYKQIASEDGSLYIIGHGRCRGHLIDYHDNKNDNKKALQTCLECSWKSHDFKAFHCCCSEETKADLPPNFYLGCNGPVND